MDASWDTGVFYQWDFLIWFLEATAVDGSMLPGQLLYFRSELKAPHSLILYISTSGESSCYLQTTGGKTFLEEG